MRLSILTISALPGCAIVVYHSQECETSEVQVGEGDPLGDLDFTVGELLATVEGVFAVELTAPDGTIHVTEVSTVRRGGAATFWDATILSVESQSDRHTLFPRDAVVPMEVECSDRVEVPVDIHADSADGSLVVHGEGIASNNDETLALVNAARDLDLATDHLVPPLGDLDQAMIEIQYGANGLEFVSTWWTRETPYDYEQSLHGPL